ncbi:hypothetical protein TRAPUB_4899 [Trametes pubescens]|uniref:Uncharacterized protein n=1 Tax=Trametes pubescens TaxID=154538 RepID=A0A1M2V9U9_TRAPU|nr:hypothetical protein TRAPUB_4899 [Trametes pubescens]
MPYTLERSKTQSHKESTFTLRTLQCEKLSPEDRISLSVDRREINVRFCSPEPTDVALTHAPAPFLPTPGPSDLKVRLLPGPSLEKFPAGLTGFPYYLSPPSHITPLAGEVRLRQTHSPDRPFARGEDYCIPMGPRWRIPLLTIAAMECYEPLQHVLLREGLVSTEVMEHARALGLEYKLLRNISRIVHSFRQPFIVDLRTHEHTFYFLGHRGLHQSTFWNLCTPKGEQFRHHMQPFEGKLLCCFEPSKHPKYAGRRVVVMRVLRILSPVSYVEGYRGPRNMPPPSQGKLLRSYYNVGQMWRKEGTWGVWTEYVARRREMGVLFEHQDQGAARQEGLRRLGHVSPEPSVGLSDLQLPDAHALLRRLFE